MKTQLRTRQLSTFSAGSRPSEETAVRRRGGEPDGHPSTQRTIAAERQSVGRRIASGSHAAQECLKLGTSILSRCVGLTSRGVCVINYRRSADLSCRSHLCRGICRPTNG